jgi:hypothetical protein
MRPSRVQAWLGYYNALCRKCGWDKETLVKTANYFATGEKEGLGSRIIGFSWDNAKAHR